MNNNISVKLDRHSSIPLHQQLGDLLMEKITSGSLSAGEKLPSETELMNTFHISRHVIRQTVNNLRQQGLIYTEHGVGSFVSQERIEKPLDILQSYHESMRKSRFVIQVSIVRKEIIRPPEEIAEKLKTGIKSVFYLERISFVENKPVNILMSYISPDACGYEKLMKLSKGSLYAHLEKECGITLVHSSNCIEVVFAQEFESRLLDLARGSVLMQISGVSFDQQGMPIEYSRVVYPGGLFCFHFDSYISGDSDDKRKYIATAQEWD